MNLEKCKQFVDMYDEVVSFVEKYQDIWEKSYWDYNFKQLHNIPSAIWSYDYLLIDGIKDGVFSITLFHHGYGDSETVSIEIPIEHLLDDEWLLKEEHRRESLKETYEQWKVDDEEQSKKRQLEQMIKTNPELSKQICEQIHQLESDGK